MKRIAPFAGWAALFLLFSALFFYIAVPHEKEVILPLTVAGVIFALSFAFAKREALKRGMKTRSALMGLNSAALTAILLGILVFVNLIADRHKHRFDTTETGAFTLAPQTVKIVQNLPREVKITAFFQTQAPEKADFRDLIEGYLGLSDKISVTYVDPDKSPSITKRYGVTTYGTVALESGAQETKVKEANEENLTNALLKISKDEKKKIYFLTGHGEKDLKDAQGPGYSTAKSLLMQDAYEVEELLLLQTAVVPDDAALLVAAGPEKPISPQEQAAIETYLDQGGAMFLLVDPQSSFGMEETLARYGIGLREDIVIDPVSKLLGGDFAAPVISQYVTHDITRDFKLATIFPVSRTVRALPEEGVETLELLLTGESSWAENELDSTQVKFNEGKDEKGPVPVAVLASKPVADAKTLPKPEGDEKAPEPPKGRLMVVGDSDFASNQYINFSGNGDFFLNTSSWLTDEKNLISIRPKSRKDTPIELTRAGGTVLFFLGMVVIPGCVALAGFRNWWRRRRL
ncbi:MAG: Gldg family protein [Nitrospinaceae bacterium]|nr:MAG: Gldg family protein [Nitrospinaceae bacterium]